MALRVATHASRCADSPLCHCDSPCGATATRIRARIYACRKGCRIKCAFRRCFESDFSGLLRGTDRPETWRPRFRTKVSGGWSV